jgi:Arc/MetJ-type ribon-helix-helix transcriptional regulator
MAVPYPKGRVVVIRKKRCTFMIEPEVLERLQSITARTGLSKSEQIRQGIRWWLESREWPLRPLKAARTHEAADVTAAARPGNGRRHGTRKRR